METSCGVRGSPSSDNGGVASMAVLFFYFLFFLFFPVFFFSFFFFVYYNNFLWIVSLEFILWAFLHRAYSEISGTGLSSLLSTNPLSVSLSYNDVYNFLDTGWKRKRTAIARLWISKRRVEERSSHYQDQNSRHFIISSFISAHAIRWEEDWHYTPLRVSVDFTWQLNMIPGRSGRVIEVYTLVFYFSRVCSCIRALAMHEFRLSVLFFFLFPFFYLFLVLRCVFLPLPVCLCSSISFSRIKKDWRTRHMVSLTYY